MKLLDKHLVRGFLPPFFSLLVVFATLFIIVDYFNNLDEFLRYNSPFQIVVTYYLYLLPTLLVQIVPIAVLVSILFLLGVMSKHNEVTAMKASGVNTFSILSPFLFLGLVISFAVFLVNETVVPKAVLVSTSIKDGLIEGGKKKLQERAIKNVTLASDSRMIFAREYEIVSQTLHDVDIEDLTNRRYKIKLKARKAAFEDGQWQLYDVLKQRINLRGEIVGEPVYSPRLVMELDVNPDQFIQEASQIEFMNTKELKAYIRNFGTTSNHLANRLWVDYHSRIALPFVSLIIILIGAPLAMRSERGTAMLGIGTSVIIVFLYYAIDSICLALGKGGNLSPMVAAWTANIVFATVGLILIRKNS